LLGGLLLFSAFSIKERMKNIEYRSDQSAIIPKGIKKYYQKLPAGSEIYIIFLPDYRLIPDELKFADIENDIYFEYNWIDMEYGLLPDFFEKYFDIPLPDRDKIYFFYSDGSQVTERNDFKDKVYHKEKLFKKCKSGELQDITFTFTKSIEDKLLISGDVRYSYLEDGIKIDRIDSNSQLQIEIDEVSIDPDMTNIVYIYLSAKDADTMAIPVYLTWNKDISEYHEILNIFPDNRLRDYKLDVGYNFHWIMSPKIENIKLTFERVPESITLHRMELSCEKSKYQSECKGIDIFNP
jgi:hypothetical protein